MDHELKKAARELYQWHALEDHRSAPRESNPLQLDAFQKVEQQIHHSLKAPSLIKKHTPAGQPLKQPAVLQRSFEDQELVQKLIRMRSESRLSTRILRPGQPLQ